MAVRADAAVRSARAATATATTSVPVQVEFVQLRWGDGAAMAASPGGGSDSGDVNSSHGGSDGVESDGSDSSDDNSSCGNFDLVVATEAMYYSTPVDAFVSTIAANLRRPAASPRLPPRPTNSSPPRVPMSSLPSLSSTPSSTPPPPLLELPAELSVSCLPIKPALPAAAAPALALLVHFYRRGDLPTALAASARARGLAAFDLALAAGQHDHCRCVVLCWAGHDEAALFGAASPYGRRTWAARGRDTASCSGGGVGLSSGSGRGSDSCSGGDLGGGLGGGLSGGLSGGEGCEAVCGAECGAGLLGANLMRGALLSALPLAQRVAMEVRRGSEEHKVHVTKHLGVLLRV